MRKKKAVKENWCPLTGPYTHLKRDHILDRARALWSKPSVELRTPEGNIISGFSFTGKAIERARAIHDRWDELQQDPLNLERLQDYMGLALDPDVRDRERYLEDILGWFRGLDASGLEIFSILAIYETRVSKNDVWPRELLALTERYSPDAMLGKTRRKDQVRFAKMGIEAKQRDVTASHSKWLNAGKTLRQKHKDWSTRNIAIEVCKRLELPEKSFQNVYKLFLKNNV